MAGRSASSSRSPSRDGSIPAPLDGEVIPPLLRPRPPEGTGSPRANPSFAKRLGTGLVAILCVTALGAGVAGALHEFRIRQPASSDPTRLALERLQQDLGTLKSGVDALKPAPDAGRQDDTIRQLKKTVDSLKAELDTQRTANTTALQQLSAKLDKPSPDPAPKLSEITARLDRIEKQVSSPAATGTIAAPSKSQGFSVIPQAISTPAATPEKPLPRPATLDNYVVRDVYDGLALVEGRGGGVREVAPGETLPGAGEVRSIERRGRSWIVVTSRGIIDTATW